MKMNLSLTNTARIAIWAGAILVLLFPAGLLAQVPVAELSGRVTDASGGVLPGATVTAVHVATGSSRESVTDTRGSYVLQALPIGGYRVIVMLPGFTTINREGVTLSVGQRSTINFEMVVSGVEETVTVLAGAPLVDTRRSDVASILDVAQIRDLPLVGRDWLSMTAYSPGVRSNTTGIPTTGAQSARRTKVLVDGQQMNQNYNLGNKLNFEFSQEAIQEVLVVSNRMSTEYARAGGGIVSAVTKSGTNTLQGSVYGYFRDGNFNKADWFTGRREPFTNKVYGIAAGGPVKKDRLFYFGSVEFARRDETDTFGTGIPELDVTYPRGVRRNSVFTRFDIWASQSHQLNVRLGYDNASQFRSIVAPGFSAATDVDQWAKLVGVNWTSVLSDRTVNEFTYQYMPMNWRRTLMNMAPGLIFPTARLGTSNNCCFDGSEHFNLLRNNLTRHVGENVLKVGVEFMYVNQFGMFGDLLAGNFLFRQDPTDWAAVVDVTRAHDRARLQRLVDEGIVPVPVNATQAIGDPNFRTPQPMLGAFFQNDWKIHPQLTLNLGVRYDIDFGAMLPNFRSRYVTDERHPETDKNDIAPRLGFAWDVAGDGHTVIRGGAGRYYDQVHNNLTFAHQIFNGDTYAQVVTFPGTPPRSDFMVNPTGGLTLENVVQQGLIQDIRPMHADFKTSKTDQLALGAARELGENFAVQADFLHIIGSDESYYTDANVFCDPTSGDPLPVLRFGRPDGRYNRIREARSDGRSRYTGLQTGAKKRFSNNFQWSASYTLSWSNTNTGNEQTEIPEPCNLAGLYGPADTDQRHRATFNMLYQLPYGVQLGGVIVTTSGRRFRIEAGRDLNGDLNNNDLARHPDGSKMLWAGGVGEPVFRVDLRVSKRFSVYRDSRVELIAEAFNVFNRRNYNSYQSRQTSRLFMKPTRSGDLNFQPFQGQLAVRWTF